MFPHTINIYSGGSYNEIHDCENVYLSCEKAEVHVDKKPVVGEAQKEPSRLPEELLTDAARTLHAKLMDAGMVDEAWRPVGLSNAEKGVLVFQVAVRLDIQNHWQVFAALWGTTPGTLRTAYNKANEQRKTMSFIEKLNTILS